MIETSPELTRFFAWARERAYVEFDRLMAEDPARDPNWTFSEIMQLLLEDYRRQSGLARTEARTEARIEDRQAGAGGE